MLEELSLVLDEVPADAPSSAYRSAVVERNVLGKATRSTRLKTAKYLVELYALNPRLSVFRLLRFFWSQEQSGKPMLAFLAACTQRHPSARFDSLRSRDSDRRSREPHRDRGARPRAVSRTISTHHVKIHGAEPGFLVDAGGLLAGKLSKRRSRPVVTPKAAAYALVLGYLLDCGESCCSSRPWTQLLDRPTVRGDGHRPRSLEARVAAYKAAGSVVEITFPGLLTPAEERRLHEPN